MKKLTLLTAVLAASAACSFQTQVLAMEHDQMMGHGGKGAMAQGQATEATHGTGVINSVDAEGGSVNITHEPIPALSWPAMTMDLPVTDAVDLSGVSAGDRVDFAIILGSDNVYRITELKRPD
ncbi:copper-binding protein [Thiocystis violacea]|uniref:copper-binding protein n=1 Tax=Thiocystis violacea TaxID=13725 RepID=UPI001905A877|nr:copper-binding protein [Thiocystis violacea]MBK1722931.1 hypothetical protein [Thiocystis violacea]